MTKTAISFLGLLAFALLLGAQVQADSLLLISVDGLGADDLDLVHQGKLKLPAIESLMKGGAYANRVKGVLPSITYPSHTTLITGVSPLVHGIESNIAFDPLGKNKGGWSWYSSDIKVPTLWDSAHNAGKKVASVNWPVSVGSTSIDYNIPEFWLARTAQDIKILRALSPTLLPELEQDFFKEFGEPLVTPFSDVALTRMVELIIKSKRPDLTTLHIVELDHVKHVYGPRSKEAFEQLKETDVTIGNLIDRVKKLAPNMVIALVSDHGFAPVQDEANLFDAFVRDGLISVDEAKGEVAQWQAMPWPNGGSTAIILKNPHDKATQAQVEKLLARLKSDPRNGINSVKQVLVGNDSKGASFWVDFKFGFWSGMQRKGPAFAKSLAKGMHGYFPDHQEMDAVFVISGSKLLKKGSLGNVDMQDVAPTLADILGFSLPTAQGRHLF